MFDWLCGARPGAVTASGLHTSYAGLLGGAKWAIGMMPPLIY